MSGRWYLRDWTAANWPDVEPWRTESDALTGRGYDSEDQARAAARAIGLDYNRRKGASGPDLRAMEAQS